MICCPVQKPRNKKKTSGTKKKNQEHTPNILLMQLNAAYRAPRVTAKLSLLSSLLTVLR